MIKLDFIKIKNFYSSNDIVKIIKRQATSQEEIFAKYVSDKEFGPRIYKECLKLSNKTGRGGSYLWEAKAGGSPEVRSSRPA